jgi:hypothetical protein
MNPSAGRPALTKQRSQLPVEIDGKRNEKKQIARISLQPPLPIHDVITTIDLSTAEYNSCTHRSW